jgi:hypothetical protein
MQLIIKKYYLKKFRALARPVPPETELLSVAGPRGPWLTETELLSVTVKISEPPLEYIWVTECHFVEEHFHVKVRIFINI